MGRKVAFYSVVWSERDILFNCMSRKGAFYSVVWAERDIVFSCMGSSSVALYSVVWTLFSVKSGIIYCHITIQATINGGYTQLGWLPGGYCKGILCVWKKIGNILQYSIRVHLMICYVQ